MLFGVAPAAYGLDPGRLDAQGYERAVQVVQKIETVAPSISTIRSSARRRSIAPSTSNS